MPILGIPLHFYKEPERLSPAEARLRRIQNELKRVEVLERSRSSLSQANVNRINELKEFQRKFGADLEDRRADVRRAEKYHDEQRTLRSAAQLKAARLAASKLAARQSELRQAADAQRRRNRLAAASAPNRRYGLPGVSNPRTVFGTEAYTFVNTRIKSLARKFVSRDLSIPCLDRATRREVMFAKGHGGKGFKVPHKLSPLSMIGC